MTEKKTTGGSTYAQSGVDIAAAAELVEQIKSIAAPTLQSSVLSGIGGFGALCALPSGYAEPILVSGTDGVGTKLLLANQLSDYSGIGIDLVAMCANDILCHGAQPLFFLDYYATGKLNVTQAAQIIQSIADGCQLAGASLIGGETAELPGLYHGDDYDLAGFCVGVVEKAQLLPQPLQPGAVLLALGSSGPHANGYSLIRKVLNDTQADLSQLLSNDQTLAATLLAPTRIYVSAVQALLAAIPVQGLAHITGGGLTENLPRILNDDIKAVVDSSSWQWPEVFTWLQSRGNIAEAEMRKTFNLGVGMVIAVAAEHVDAALALLQEQGEQAWVMGNITPREGGEALEWLS